jgi:SAM-dependent methyltransferase
MLKNDMLHYGYFEDVDILPDHISISQLENAQIKYAENIIELITDTEGLILDVGCGMGGLSGLMLEKKLHTEALTPNINQFQYIKSKYPDLVCYHTKFEQFKTEKKYATIINSESLQYINLNEAFSNIDSLLINGGKWIIVDYFRNQEIATNKSGHNFNDFIGKINEYSWKIIYQKDISLNVVPTIKFLNMYAQRFLLPIKHFAFEKLRYKKAWLYFLTEDLQKSIDKKINKELNSINPEIFFKEKSYKLLVIEKPS